MDVVPIEILRVILEAAIENGRFTYAELWLEETPLSKFREQQALIRKLGSVCNRWRSICLEFLFEHVWIAPPLESNTLAFRQIFNTNTLSGHSRNPLGWWTRQLYLDILFLGPPERKALIDHFRINKPFPNVDHLVILNCESNRDEENSELILDVYAEHLISLTLNGSEDAFHHIISRNIGGLSQLQVLTLEFADESLRKGERDTLVLPSVHTLHLQHTSDSECFDLVDWELPLVRTLSLLTLDVSRDTFGPFIRLGCTLTSLTLPYWPVGTSFHETLFKNCRVLERLEVLDTQWEGEDSLELVAIAYLPILEEHGLREWVFHPFWVDCDFDSFQINSADPKMLPSLRIMRLLSPGVDRLFSLSLRRVQSLKEWSRALKLRGVLLVDDGDGTLIFLSTICIGGDSDQRSSSLLRMMLYVLGGNYTITVIAGRKVTGNILIHRRRGL